MDIFWIIIIIFGTLYFFIKWLIDLTDKVKKKLEVQVTQTNVVPMEVVNKFFVEGKVEKIGGNILPSKYPDSYIIELKYKDSYYKINDYELYNNSNIGDIISLQLINNIDKNGNIINYSIKKYEPATI